jgi:hypothetical protein
MLGQAARTADDTRSYQARYRAAIAAVSTPSAGRGPIGGPGMSITLSALDPHIEVAQGVRLRDSLLPPLTELAQAAKAGDIGLTIDAEEAARLDVTLDSFAALCAEPSRTGWEGLGTAVQAYQWRALRVVDPVGRAGRAPWAQDPCAFGQGRPLGFGGQVDPAAGSATAPRPHSQGARRPALPLLRPVAPVSGPTRVSAVRHPQRAHSGCRLRYGQGNVPSSCSACTTRARRSTIWC